MTWCATALSEIQVRGLLHVLWVEVCLLWSLLLESDTSLLKVPNSVLHKVLPEISLPYMTLHNTKLHFTLYITIYVVLMLTWLNALAQLALVLFRYMEIQKVTKTTAHIECARLL